MATTTIAQYATAKGAVVTAEERTTSGLWDITYVATCSGCRAGTTETTAAELARRSALLWAERHANSCRRTPS